MTSAASQPEIQCPRCGYDLRGTVSTWKHACPLRGICTECGLEIDWSQVLQPEKFEPRWCVEYAARRAWPGSCGRTFLRSFLPWPFWSRLSMHHRIRWLRLGLYVGLFSLMPVFVSYLLVQSAAALHMRSQVQAGLDTQLNYIARFQRQAYWDSQQAWAASNPQISHSAWYCVYEAVCFPSRSLSRVIVTGTPTRPYPAPADLHGGLMYMLGGQNIGVPTSAATLYDFAFGSGLGFAVGLGVFAMLPLTFVLLPISRRRAKVRWGHVLRVTAYGVFIPVTTLMIIAASFALWVIRDSQLLFVFTAIVAWWLVPIALVLWWTAGIGCYLKMPRGALIAIMMALLSWLLLLGMLYFMFPDHVIAWLLSW